MSGGRSPAAGRGPGLDAVEGPPRDGTTFRLDAAPGAVMPGHAPR